MAARVAVLVAAAVGLLSTATAFQPTSIVTRWKPALIAPKLLPQQTMHQRSRHFFARSAVSTEKPNAKGMLSKLIKFVLRMLRYCLGLRNEKKPMVAPAPLTYPEQAVAAQMPVTPYATTAAAQMTVTPSATTAAARPPAVRKKAALSVGAFPRLCDE
jgi:hypothetical protein